METVCIVDDEPEILSALHGILEDEGYPVVMAQSGHEALKVVRSELPDLILLDIWMPDLDGLETLTRIRQQFPNIFVIMMSGHGSIETAVRATKLGAYDYLEKPLDLEKVIILVRNALHQRKLEEENQTLRIQVERRFELVGSSPPMKRLNELIAMAAPTNSWVLLSGANGTGKELVARAIHLHSARKHRPFVEVNCAAIPETLIESELFGHERGAFSGANALKRGKFEMADSGTLFLDEVGDMSLATQAKVLRALQEQQFTRLGGTKLVNVQVRVIAASNKDIPEEIEKGNFREDLYYRLNVLPIAVPTLWERRDDIPELAQHFLRLHAEEQGIKNKVLTDQAVEVLRQHHWPGNIRELRNLLERLLIMVPRPVIDGSDVEMFLQVRKVGTHFTSSAGKGYQTLREARNAFERVFITTKLRDNGWNVSKTADTLQIERSHLHRKIKLLNIEFRSDHASN